MQKYTCEICTESKNSDQIFHNTLCAIEHLMCEKCITDVVKTKLECPFCKVHMLKKTIVKGVRGKKINESSVKFL